jgi:hypothetical protein
MRNALAVTGRRLAWRNVLRPALLILIAAGAVSAFPSDAGSSHSIASFYTPGKAAYCKFHVPLEPIGASYPPPLECWTPNDGFTVSMTDGRVSKRYVSGNKWRFARSIRRLTFRQNWWSSTVGLVVDDFGNSYDDYREGTGAPKGIAIYRCSSRATGLTCRNRVGHGWWLGRYRGYRIF